MSHARPGQPADKAFELAIDPKAYASFQRRIYASLMSPRFPSDTNLWEPLARSRLKLEAYNYVAGSAGLGRTASANVAAFSRYRLKPSMFVDSTTRSTKIELFGRTLSSPLLVAPIGVQGIVHKDGEEATARACAAVGVPMILSTAATRSIEQVAKANGNGERWYQVCLHQLGDLLRK
jgi:lactate 2-monooxygenase